jgi:hypothetical protein
MENTPGRIGWLLLPELPGHGTRVINVDDGAIFIITHIANEQVEIAYTTSAGERHSLGNFPKAEGQRKFNALVEKLKPIAFAAL